MHTPPTSPRLGAVLLAGGLSSRMGRPKEQLEWRGRPLLLHLIHLFQRRCVAVVVVGAPGQQLPALPPGVHRVDDPPAEQRGGPLVGIDVGLRALAPHAELAYLSACDNIFLSDAHLTHLYDRLSADPTLEAVLPVDPPAHDPRATSPERRRAHPLASLLQIAPALPIARALLAAGQRRPLALFERLHSAWLPADQLPDPRVLRTCNTPEEYAAALAEADAAP
ncbi:MAG: NTP transferase domain-containing protein [Nannocystis sp.]|nr:NTP transferase domain-containing protein [Nannocystis sp.]